MTRAATHERAPEPVDEAVPRVRMSPDDRRAAILDATVPLLKTHGAMVTTRQIADAAGVAEGTLFRVFDDKAAIMVAAVARALDPGPVVEAVRAVDASGELRSVLSEVVEVLWRRAEELRGVLVAAHEIMRARGGPKGAGGPWMHGHPGAHAVGPAASGAPLVAEAPPVAPGTLQHAAAALRGRGASGPAELIAALTAVLEVHRSELRSEPAVCARILFSIITSTTHTPFASAEGLTSHEIVEVFLNGVRTRPTTPETPC